MKNENSQSIYEQIAGKSVKRRTSAGIPAYEETVLGLHCSFDSLFI